MTSDPLNLDFGRAERARAAIVESLSPQLAPDIRGALTLPDTPDWLVTNPFSVIDMWEELRGPASGTLEVPLRWRVAVPASIPVTDPPQPQLVQLYRRVILEGSGSEQAQVLAAQVLQQMWPMLTESLPRGVVQVWEGRFPDLHGRDRP